MLEFRSPLALGLSLILMLVAFAPDAATAERVPWTTSRVTGSPNPPSPYRVENAFPNLTFTNPVELVSAPGSDRLFVLELKGRILSFPNRADAAAAEVCANLAAITDGFDRAFGMVFDPGFATNRFVYVCYAQKPKTPDGTRVSRFKMLPGAVPRLDPASEEILITWLAGGHNGGSLHFGPDGCLYISTGDSEVPNPPDQINTGQDISDLLGSVLRIDVRGAEAGRAYRVPADNPFVNTPNARPEVWAYGLRNPWKMSFDFAAGKLWAADVGWEMWEMVYRIERGGNYGWSIVEGPQSLKPNNPRGPTPILPPIAVHSHTEARSITGGYVYRGARLPALRGTYVYGDYVTGKIWGLPHDAQSGATPVELVDAPFQIICFGQDRAGELFIVDYAGSIHRLAPRPAAKTHAPFPTKLSETGLFSDVRTLKPAPGVHPYNVRVEPWMDHATAERVVAIPNNGTLGVQQKHDLQIGWLRGAWTFPTDSVLAKTISLETERGNPATKRRLETQILHFDGDTWQAYNFLWNDAQTDAVLAGAEPSQIELAIKDARAPGGSHRQTWRFAARSECLLCHNSRPGFVLGFHSAQLDHAGAGSLRDFERLGFLEKATPLPTPKKQNPNALPVTLRGGESLDSRARNYLHVNCSPCHQQGGGTTATFDVRAGLAPDNERLIDHPPLQGDFGLDQARLVAPGAPASSTLLYRMAKLGHGRMPQIGSSEVDSAGLKLVAEWIAGLVAEKTPRSNEGSLDAAALEQRLTTISGALALALQLNSGGPKVSPELTQAVARKAAGKSAFVADLFERFLPDAERVKRLGRDFTAATVLSLPGDAVRGRAVFFTEGGAQCGSCHKLGPDGRDIGPDLALVGRKFDRAQLLEHLVAPSKLVEPAFAAWVVEPVDGEEFTALLRERGDGYTVFRDLTGRDVRLADAQVRRASPQQLSLMPEGLLGSLTAQQAADLLAFLASLR